LDHDRQVYAYTIPKIDVLVSGRSKAFSNPASLRTRCRGSVVGSRRLERLGRPSPAATCAAGATQNVTVNLITPGTVDGIA
jgi:hypothetical protein